MKKILMGCDDLKEYFSCVKEVYCNLHQKDIKYCERCTLIYNLKSFAEESTKIYFGTVAIIVLCFIILFNS